MALSPGSRLGPYEITSALGAGGMGEVYKAKDTRLERTVAVKVLPSHLSDRPDLRQRFEREAKAISSLQHPNICTLFDVGHEGGVDFLVMEHLEGETLADRLAKGPLPTEQVLRNGIEIAAALDKAHRQGVIHRDLKPGNIILTRSGAKVLDFGLAKIAGGPAAGPASDALSALPTQAAGTQPLTAEGTLLGTFQYMAPEQLEGQEADARSDIFALGMVLYEMTTGRPAFQGKSRASLISSIMSAEPQPIASLQPLVPPALERVIRTCLAKDPESRVQTAHDVMLQLQWISEGGSQAGLPAPVITRRKSRERVAWGVAAAGLVIAAGLGFVLVRSVGRQVEIMRFQVGAPAAVATIGSPRISPDGRTIAFDAVDSTGRAMIWIRPLSSLAAEAIGGTEGAGRPFWSPDSRFLGFIAQGKLKKVAVGGGPPQTICDARTGADGAWGRDGVILFDGGGADPIRRVSSSGGVASAAVAGDSAIVGWPEFLPDGRHFLYLVLRPRGENEIWAGDLRTKKSVKLGSGGSRVEYSPAGFLLYEREHTLVAQAFDARSLKLSGEPMPIAESVGTGPNGLAHFSVSDNGVLIHSSGAGANFRLVWMDRSGKSLGQVGQAGDLGNFCLSPDEQRVAVRIMDVQTSNRDVWVLDPARGTSTRFTFDPANDNVPLWSPDGGQIVYNSNRGAGVFNLYRKLASGGGADETLLVSGADKMATDWSRDGRFIAYQEIDPVNQADLWVLPTFGDRRPVPFLRTPFSEYLPRFSPDGRWIAYTSDESGRDEVYVQAFPGPGGKWQISSRGGSEPTWRGDGKELYYLSASGGLMSVEIKGGENFAAGVPVPLFDARITQAGWVRYAASRDGQRFLVEIPDQNAALATTTVVLNWNADMKRR